MSTQIEINQDLIKYLQNVGYRKDTVVDKLEKETKALGSVAQMQIAKEQGQFLEIIVKTSRAKSCLEIGRFTGLSTLYMARGLPSDGRIVTVDNSYEFLSLAKKYWDKDTQSLNQRKRIRNKLIFLLYIDTLILFLLTNLIVAKMMIFISN